MTASFGTMEQRTPVVVLGGFLGSGKTTLLNRLLGSPKWARSAVIINEFGSVSLDHLLVRKVSGDRVVLKNGCVCCTVRTDLQSALRALLDEVEAGDGNRFERILIETTGLADPGPVAQTLAGDPMLRRQTRLATIACTVDAVHGAHQIGSHDECINQIAAADHLLVTKGDLADPSAVDDLKRRLSGLNPLAAIIDVAAAPEALEHIVEEATRADLASPMASSLRLHCDPVQASFGPPVPHAGVSNVTIESKTPLDWTAFAVWLSAFVHAHADRVLRVKGILYVRDRERPVALHVVRNHIHPPTHIDADEARVSRIVFIVKGIDTGALKRSLLDFVATVPAGAVASDALASPRLHREPSDDLYAARSLGATEPLERNLQ